MDGQIHPPAGFGKEQYNPPTHIIHHCCVCLSVRDVGYEEITYQLNEMRTGSPADELVLHREPQGTTGPQEGSRDEGRGKCVSFGAIESWLLSRRQHVAQAGKTTNDGGQHHRRHRRR